MDLRMSGIPLDDNTSKYTCAALRYDKNVHLPGSVLKPVNIKPIKTNVYVKEDLFADTTTL